MFEVFVFTPKEMLIRSRILKGLYRSLTFVVLVCCLSLVASAQTVPSPIGFYRSLLDSISKAEGQVLLDMSGGVWRTRAQGKTVYWRIDDGTVITTKFNYDGGVLQNASMEFRPAIHVYMTGSPKLSLKVNKVSYRGDGSVIDWDVQPDGGATNVGGSPALQRHLEASRAASDMLRGRPFSLSNSAVPCNDQGSVCGPGAGGQTRPMVYRVRLVKQDADHPALLVSLRDGALLWLSKQNSSGRLFDNYVKVRAPSQVAFGDVDYDVLEREITGRLDKMEMHVQAGSIKSGDVSLSLQDGSAMTLNSLIFNRHADGSAEVYNSDSGDLTANIGLGSSIALARESANQGSLIFADGSSVSLNSFSININDQRSTRVQIDNGLINFVLNDGRLPLQDRSFLQLQSGRVTATVAGKWESGKKPVVTAQFSNLDTVIAGGLLVLNSKTEIRLTGGQVKSHDLSFTNDTSDNKNFVKGEFTKFRVDVGEGSTVGIPGGFSLVTAPSGQLDASDPEAPLKIISGRGLPVGRINLSLPFRTFDNAQTQVVSLANGSIHLPLEFGADGSINNISNNFISLDNATTIVSSEQASFTTTVNITEGTLSMPNGSVPHFEAKWSAVIPQGIVIPIKTPSESGNGHGKTTFSVKFNVKTLSPIAIPAGTKIIFDGTHIQMAEFKQDFRYQLEVPAGHGEHSDGDNADSSENNDSDMQEVASDQQGTCPGCCRWHFFIKPGTANVDAKLGVMFDDRGLHLSVSENKTNDEIGTDHYGCSLVTTALCSLILTPALCVPGAVIGTSILNDRIAQRVREVISQDRTWTMRIPASNNAGGFGSKANRVLARKR